LCRETSHHGKKEMRGQKKIGFRKRAPGKDFDNGRKSLQKSGVTARKEKKEVQFLGGRATGAPGRRERKKKIEGQAQGSGLPGGKKKKGDGLTISEGEGKGKKKASMVKKEVSLLRWAGSGKRNFTWVASQRGNVLGLRVKKTGGSLGGKRETERGSQNPGCLCVRFPEGKEGGKI